MGSMEVAVLKFTQKQTCFIAVPRAWVNGPNYLHDGLVVYEVSSLSEKKVHLSWNGDVTEPTPWTADFCVEVNAALALSFGFKDGQEVIVQKRNEGVHEARQIVIKPVSADDWETLNANASFVESNLMNQIRLVWCGMAFPIWIPPGSYISVTVASVSPNFQPVLLVNNTEVVVVPNLEPHEGGAVPPPFLSPSFDEEQPSNVLSALKSLVSSVSASMTRTVRPSPSVSQPSSPQVESPPRYEDSLVWVKGAILVARVVPRASFQDLANATSRPHVCTLLSHPTTVFVSRTLLPPRFPGETEDVVVTFLANVTKVASPLERFVKGTVDNKSKQGTSVDKSRKTRVVDCEQCVVRVFAVPLSWTDFEFLHCTDLILVSDVLRRQLGLNYASKVKLQSLSEKPGTYESVVLHPVGNTDPRLPQQVVITSFRNWCRELSNSEYPLVLSSGGLVRLKTGDNQWTDHLVRICRHKSETDDESKKPPGESLLLEYTFFDESLCVQVGELIKPQASKSCVITLPMQLLSDVNPEPLGTKLEQLGGVEHLYEKALALLELLLQATPLAQQLRGDQQLSGAVLLITGQRGSGKSTLARALAQRMADSPAFAYVQTVDCASLSGKRAEKVSKHWGGLVAECAFREPSVLLFDDLDAIVGSVAGPEQENSPTASYFDKMADVFLSTLALLRKSCSRAAVIVTGRSWESFHSRLTASHGNHVFYTALNIQPPNKAEREDMLRSLIQMRPHLEGAFSLNEVASKTEGCLARDLVNILDRATHSACLNSADNEDMNNLVLTNDDFESALEEFCPSSLRGLNLRTEDTLSWDDAGGLEEVKKTLQEVFFWPTKYPELFANSPIRPLSGLLLYGAPGTGKTLLAGIVASECGVNFISIKGPELLSKYIGASEQAVRNVFQRAQSAKPCIIFFDEFDSIAPRRGHDSTGVTDRVVNQLLTLLDGVETSTGVYVLAATSRPDLIDPALLRPGRLDKCLHCPLPTMGERLCILQALSRKLLMADDVDLASVAQRTDHFSGADLQALLYTSQLEVVHEVFPERERSVKGRRLDNSSSSEEAGSASDTDFFYAPAAGGDMSPMLGPEQNRQLVLEVEALTENLLGHGGRRQQRRRSRRDSTALALTIHQRHLEGALTKTQASVSASERAKFDAIYALFRSGTSLTELRLSGGQRVTLA